MSALSSVVYLIQADCDLVKIGWTTDLAARFSSLRSSVPQHLELLRQFDGGRATERWLHKRFSDRRVGGEWFEFCPEMLTVIPPDELPVAVQGKPIRRQLRKTFTEEYLEAKALGMLDPGHARQGAFLLVQAMWEDDLQAFLQWAEKRASACKRSTPSDLTEAS